MAVSLGMVTAEGPTPFVELNGLVLDLAGRARDVLGADFVGAYLQGSFALGDADEHSDCDFVIVVADRPSAVQEAALRALHDEIPTREGHWCRHLEGCYVHATDLARLDTIGADWLYVRHGSREIEWSPRWNCAVVRWTLREHGATIVGPGPSSLVAPVPADLLREEMRRDLPGFLDDVSSWAWPFRMAWAQRYVVATYCRMLYTLATGEVTSKPVALRWAMDTLDPGWRPLLTQVLDDRGRGMDFADRSRPGSIKATLTFAAYAVSLIGRDPRQWSGEHPDSPTVDGLDGHDASRWADAGPQAGWLGRSFRG